jgi:hypothetical protein
MALRLGARERSMKPLFIPLTKHWFNQFESGTKTTELRIYGPRWNEKTCTPGRAVTLSCGYGKARRLHGTIIDFDISKAASSTPDFVAAFPKIKHMVDVACIHIRLEAKE